MGKKTNASAGMSRRELRAAQRDEYAAKPKEAYQSSFQPPKLAPKNDRQRDAMDALRDGVPYVFLTGSAGTGKSLLAAERVACWLRSRSAAQGKKVFLVRPAVGVGKSIGLLPGEIEEKMGPYFAQTLAHVGKFMKPGDLAYALEKDVIEMKPIEYMRGMSFDNCIVLVEEAQNLTAEEMEMMLTRHGEDNQIIFTGDTKQHDLEGESGMKTAIDLMHRMLQTQPNYMNDEDLDALDDGLAVVTFRPEDVVRSGLTRAITKMYYHND